VTLYVVDRAIFPGQQLVEPADGTLADALKINEMPAMATP
jgi:hypothetical protein